MITTNIRKATLELYTALIQKKNTQGVPWIVQNKEKAALSDSF